MAELASLGLIVVPDGRFTTIQSAVNFAALNPRAAVWIRADYFGIDGYTNPLNVPIFDMRAGGSVSFGGGSVALNVHNVWTAIQTFTRFSVVGTPITTGYFALAGWGSGALVTSWNGYDSAHTFTITAGSVPSVDPTIAFTFADGAYNKAPVVLIMWSGGTGQASDCSMAVTASGYTATFLGLPANGDTYSFTVITIGLN